ncbi:MAG: zinc metallopeptidase [Clostridia bacterium]|nr:zinc metallopeptidase [Clostridia bacterium]
MTLEIALMIVGVLIAIVGIVSGITSIWLVVKYFRFNRRENSLGLTGIEVARKILDDNGLEHIKVKRTGSLFFGNSYSHYFKKVRLRGFIRHETSLTSMGMGAQKAALAILDKEGDADMRKRIRLVPLVTFGPFAFIPLILIGGVLDYFVFNGSGICTLVLGTIGLLFYVYSVVLSVLTLKTEKKAQNRAYEILEQDYHITNEELSALKELFHLYNVQYINDIILSSLELLYTVLEIAIAVKGHSDN